MTFLANMGGWKNLKSILYPKKSPSTKDPGVLEIPRPTKISYADILKEKERVTSPKFTEGYMNEITSTLSKDPNLETLIKEIQDRGIFELQSIYRILAEAVESPRKYSSGYSDLVAQRLNEIGFTGISHMYERSKHDKKPFRIKPEAKVALKEMIKRRGLSQINLEDAAHPIEYQDLLTKEEARESFLLEEFAYLIEQVQRVSEAFGQLSSVGPGNIKPIKFTYQSLFTQKELREINDNLQNGLGLMQLLDSAKISFFCSLAGLEKPDRKNFWEDVESIFQDRPETLDWIRKNSETPFFAKLLEIDFSHFAETINSIKNSLKRHYSSSYDRFS